SDSYRPDPERRPLMSRPVDPEARAARFIALEQHEETHDRLVWGMRQHRDTAVAAIPEWETLRALASPIKEHTLTHLDRSREQFEANATKLGTQVHWARDAAEHNAIVHELLEAHGVTALIKSKSMLQEECGMTPFLQKRGIEVTESDLGERIQQLSGEPPSHIVVPAIHKLRSDVAELFAEELGSDRTNDDPHYLNEAMRQNARPRFLLAGAAMMGGQLCHRRDGRVRGLHQRGQRRYRRQRATPPHCQHRHREADPTSPRPRGLHPHAVAQRAGLAHHAVHLPLPRAAAWRGAARGARRQRAQ